MNMKQTIITFLFALVAMAGQAQTIPQDGAKTTRLSLLTVVHIVKLN